MVRASEITALIAAQQYDTALSQLQPCLEGSQAEHGGLLYYYAAWCCDALGLEAQAVPYYVNAIRYGLPDADLRDAYVGLGSTYRILGAYQSAWDTLHQGLALFPQSLPLKVFAAMADYNLGRHREAVSQLLLVVAQTATDGDLCKYGKAIALYAQDLDRVERT